MIEWLLACAAPPEERDDTGVEETGDTLPDPCPDGTTAVFTGDDGSSVDLTEALSSGTYTTLEAPGTLAVCPGTWFARLLIRADVTVEGLGYTPSDTILSGGESGTILDVLGPDVTLTVRNLTLDRGAGLDEAHNSGGGGIYCEGLLDDTTTKVIAADVVFSNNYANDGAGLYAVSCATKVSDSWFVDNLSDDDGGAFTSWYASTHLERVTFLGNQALDGGALAIFYGDIELEDVVFEDNVATHVAGAAWLYSSVLDMRGGAFLANENTGVEAGALLVYGSAALDGVAFTNNVGLLGGGLYVYYEAAIEASGCDFSGNTDDDVYAADYSEAGGVSYTAGDDATFTCSANVCTGL